MACPPLLTWQCRTNSFIHSAGFSGLRYLPSSSTSAYHICSLSVFVHITIAHCVLPGKMLSKAHGINQPLQLATTWQTARGAGSGEGTGLSVGSFSDTAECKSLYSVLWSLQSVWPMAAGLVIVNVIVTP